MAASRIKVTCPLCPVEIEVEQLLVIDTMPDSEGSYWRGSIDFDRAGIQSHLLNDHVLVSGNQGAQASSKPAGGTASKSI